MSKKADKFIEKYIVGKDDWLLKHKEVISKLLDEYESEQLTLTDVGSSLPFESSESKLCKTCNGNGVMWFNKE